MKSTEIRSQFFSFFTERGHTHIASSPVIPADDPTLLFANAGMNQFKDLFLGYEKRSYTRAVTIQKCIRAGGKHNDLDNVGFTSRHLTFFEMMGNFSFGDYFKKEAIVYAWEFLTQCLKLDASRLYASVYELDEEAYQLWHKEVGLPVERIVKLGARDNFWQMGDTGPCGPCSEIYVDRGTEYGCKTNSCAPGCSCDRFLEIWNLVFMQFDRQKDGTDKPLTQTGVDTGMGLDRLCAVIQNAESVFETDLFHPIIAQIEQLTGKTYKTSSPTIKAAFRVVADHIRSASFAIADGALPAADGRGYVIRKIIRRAALFAHKLNPEPFFPQVLDGVIASLGDIYPELKTQRTHILKVLTQEVEQFSKNLIRGKTLLEQKIAGKVFTRELPGSLAFTLYDTYGFPLELTQVIAHEYDMTVDIAGFEQEMEKQRTQSSAKETTVAFSFDPTLTTTFVGYEQLENPARITGLWHNNHVVDMVPAGADCWIVTDVSPFYVAGGGQVSDTGTVTIGSTTTPLLEVAKQGSLRACRITAPVDLRVGDTVTLHVDAEQRRDTMRNHTATHLLQAALRHILGHGVKQAGSLVAPDYLRFDFSCNEQVTPAQIHAVEEYVNDAIRSNIPVQTRITTLAEAQKAGVIAFFGEKYNPESVRVVEVAPVSAELCGGTHVRATGDIALFKITEISALAAGTRRIVALTGKKAFELFQENADTVRSLSLLLKAHENALIPAVEKVRTQLKQTQTQLKASRKQLWQMQIPVWTKQAHADTALPFGIIILEEVTTEEMRELAQRMIQAKPGLWFIINTEAEHEQIQYVAFLAPEFTARYSLKTLLKELNTLGMRGGGSDTSLQGGAPALPERLEATIRAWIQSSSKA